MLICEDKTWCFCFCSCHADTVLCHDAMMMLTEGHVGNSDLVTGPSIFSLFPCTAKGSTKTPKARDKLISNGLAFNIHEIEWLVYIAISELIWGPLADALSGS